LLNLEIIVLTTGITSYLVAARKWSLIAPSQKNGRNDLFERPTNLPSLASPFSHIVCFVVVAVVAVVVGKSYLTQWWARIHISPSSSLINTGICVTLRSHICPSWL
jgi:hypothetical protein